MAKNKKPRHKMKTRTLISPFKITTEVTERMSEFFTHFCLIAEMKLPRGECDAVDIAYIAGVFNLCTMGLASREWLDKDEHEELMPTYNKALFALHEVAERGHATGRYVCTGEELTLIRDMLIPAEQFLQDSIKTCPRRLLHEWHALQSFTKCSTVLTPREVPIEDFIKAVKKQKGV